MRGLKEKHVDILPAIFCAFVSNVVLHMLHIFDENDMITKQFKSNQNTVEEKE